MPFWPGTRKSALVDEFAHTNVPGAQREKRWEDVEILLNAGIHVLTTMNIQHLESLNDQVRQITGVRVRETIPDWVVQKADEVVMSISRPGLCCTASTVASFMIATRPNGHCQNFFRESNLVALRGLALRETAHEVEHRNEEQGTSDSLEERELNRRRKHHRILVLVTSDPKTAMAIRRARRVSDFLGAECFAVAVQKSDGPFELPKEQRDVVAKHLNFARSLHIETRVLEGADPATVVVEFARQNGVTQIFVTRPPVAEWRFFARGDTVRQIVRQAKDMQIVIVSDREPV